MKSSTIEIPNHKTDQIIKLYVESGKLKKTLNREPADEEIAESLGWTVKRVCSVKKLANEILNEANYTGDVLDLLGAELQPVPDTEITDTEITEEQKKEIETMFASTQARIKELEEKAIKKLEERKGSGA